MITLVRGLNGPKKLEFINKTCKGAIIISEDQYYVVDGRYHFDKNKQADAKKYCLVMMTALSKCNIDMVVSNTFVKKAWLFDYIKKAQELGIKAVVKSFNEDTESIYYIPPASLDWIKQNWEE